MITLYTAHYRYAGLDRFDITVKGNDPLGKYFAPAWEMVMNYKKGIFTEQQYVEQYIPILQKLPLNIINEFLTPQERTLVCFCKENAFCHRNIVVNYFMRLYPNNVVYGGFRK